MLTTQRTISVYRKPEVGFGRSAKEERKKMELAWSCTLPGECLKEKGSQGRRWNAGGTGSRASLFHLRNLHDLKWNTGF